MSVILHFSLGPVQTFVAQARRTRDLWAGSYLLSYLSARALQTALERGGEVGPALLASDPMVEWLRGRRPGAPAIGSLPNHFSVHVSSVDEARQIGLTCQRAVRDAWEQICQAVWEQYVTPAEPSGNTTRGIWDRQTRNFWEILWVVGEENEADLLDRRKRWRTHWLPDEPGDKCSLMHDFQELSGWLRARPEERRKQDEFWNRIRDRVGELEIRKNERLCAVALVKRLFPYVVRQAIGANLRITRWPSTVYIAAVPWLRTVLDKCPAAAKSFANRLAAAAPPETFIEFDEPFGFSNASDTPLRKIDAYYLHRASLRNPEVTPLKVEGDRSTLLTELRDLQKCAGATPAAYYAVIQADGDRVGAFAAQLKKQRGDSGLKDLSMALSAYSAAVSGDEFRRKYDAVLIYAGGDDLLAFSPLESALDFAQALREEYEKAFRSLGNTSIRPSLSAAIVFAHIHAPLFRVLTAARDSLDQVAKRANGRDSVVVTVYRHGGLGLQWVTSWKRQSATGPRNDSSALMLHRQLVQLLEQEKELGLSMSLMSRLHEALVELSGASGWQPGQWLALPPELDLTALLKAETFASLTKRSGEDWTHLAVRAHQYAQTIAALLPRCRGDGVIEPTSVSGDVLLLARFLATGGAEEAHA